MEDDGGRVPFEDTGTVAVAFKTHVCEFGVQGEGRFVTVLLVAVTLVPITVSKVDMFSSPIGDRESGCGKDP